MKVMKVTQWKKIEHDERQCRYYYEREILRDDGKIIVQIAFRGDCIPDRKGIANTEPFQLYNQFVKKDEGFKVRAITQEERELAIRRRGRGLGIEPSHVIVSLANQRVFADIATDVDGGLGTIEGSAQ